ncbi:hypothetical protein SDC9_88439 [bioreactor metagenome]|uniref:Uncharacterized protein n=1 Tax=bioreactor metagenome TaxID=1076179 RepID=A0A644ZLL4_9ZZZZ
MEVPALAEDGDTGGACMNQALQVRIVLGFGISSAGRTEGNQFGVLQGQILGAEEKFQILWIRAGIPSLDETDPQRIQGLDDLELILDGEADALGLAAIAQGGVKQCYLTHRLSPFSCRSEC